MDKWISISILIFFIALLSLIRHFATEIVAFFSAKKTKENLQPSGQNVAQPELNAMTNDGQLRQNNEQSVLKYDPANYNKVTYHPDLIDTSYNVITVIDASGTPREISYQPVQSLPIYHQPGSFMFGSTSYVPTYEDSVYLSKTTRLSSVKPLYKTADMMGGFCEQLKTDPIAMEQTCNSIPSNQCASNTCCVLLGGDKCVAGNQYGPTRTANFSDPFLKNKDFYYYLGKCYGNCQK